MTQEAGVNKPDLSSELNDNTSEGSSKVGRKCIHHWLIETPHGATSYGRCRLCDGSREFVNTFADHGWETGVFPDLEESPLPEIKRYNQ